MTRRIRTIPPGHGWTNTETRIIAQSVELHRRRGRGEFSRPIIVAAIILAAVVVLIAACNPAQGAPNTAPTNARRICLKYRTLRGLRFPAIRYCVSYAPWGMK